MALPWSPCGLYELTRRNSMVRLPVPKPNEMRCGAHRKQLQRVGISRLYDAESTHTTQAGEGWFFGGTDATSPITRPSDPAHIRKPISAGRWTRSIQASPRKGGHYDVFDPRC